MPPATGTALIILVAFLLPGFVTVLLKELTFKSAEDPTPLDRLLRTLSYSVWSYLLIAVVAIPLGIHRSNFLRWYHAHTGDPAQRTRADGASLASQPLDRPVVVHADRPLQRAPATATRPGPLLLTIKGSPWHAQCPLTASRKVELDPRPEKLKPALGVIQHPEQQICEEHNLARFGRIAVFDLTVARRILEHADRASKQRQHPLLFATIERGVDERSALPEGLVHELDAQERVRQAGKLAYLDLDLPQRRERRELVLAEKELRPNAIADPLVQVDIEARLGSYQLKAAGIVKHFFA